MPKPQHEHLPPVEELSRWAMELHRARHAGDPGALVRIRAHYPFERLRGKSDEEIQAEFFTRVDAHQVIAHELGFEDWQALLDHRERPDDLDFEVAADAVVAGDLERLRTLLKRRPDLVSARSARKHGATLLHYISANGVELERQHTPPNIVEVTAFLLESGADPDALAGTYEGGLTNTTLYLLVSSNKPRDAGVQGALVEALVRHGAKVDGILDDGLPLATAIVFDCPPAVDALVRCGARIDNLVFAAAVGDMTILANCFDGDRVRSNAIGRSIHGLRVSADPTTALEQALVYAAMHGRPEAVAFLLDHGADPDATIDLQQSALHWAAFEGHLEIVELLLAHGADPERRDRRWNSTPRGWAEHGKRDAVVERLR